MTRAVEADDKLRLAEAELGAGRYASAIELLRATVRIDRQSPRPRLLLAFALAQSGQGEEAVRVLRRLIEAAPANADAWFNLGNLYRWQQRLDEALHAFRRVILLRPENVDAYINFAYVLVQLGRFAEANRHLHSSLERFPAEPDLLLTHAQVQRATHRLEEASATLDRCVSLAPAHPGYRVTRAMVLRDLGDTERARAELDRLIEEHPDFPDAHSARAQIHFSLGNCRAAWHDFLWRPDRAQWLQEQGKPAGMPPPTLEQIRGRAVVLWEEQGLGDVVFFLRFAPLLEEAASSLHLAVNRHLVPILPARWHAPAPADAIPLLMGDLGVLFPEGPVPSLGLAPDPTRAAQMRNRLLACGPGPYVGVTWQAGFRPEHTSGPGTRLFKRIPPLELGQALKGVGATLVSLQRGDLPQDLAALRGATGRQVHDFSAVNGDLAEALALLSQLDDYIAVSNTNVHLRDALGKRSRVLATHPAEWRWSVSGNRSPWLTHVELYRQDARGAWDTALARLRRDLDQ